jgi:hypothetical protein
MEIEAVVAVLISIKLTVGKQLVKSVAVRINVKQVN